MKTLICMRGLPGSGKSTKAKTLATLYSGVIYSTDDLFMVNGKYQFDAGKLSENHTKTRDLVTKALESGSHETVILDNTNITQRELAAYAKLCMENVLFRVEYSDASWRNDPRECYTRCTHGVPLTVIERMLVNYWCPDVSLTLRDVLPPP